MAQLPDSIIDSPTVLAIYAAHEKANAATFKPRPYLGASIIGKECDRAIWFDFRWVTFEAFDGRMLRLFQTGDIEEGRFVAELQSIGCEVYGVDPQTGQQFAVRSIGGHFSGHMDGCALGVPEAPKTWHLLEMKTHNAKSFAELRAQGVLKAKPQHYAQMQMYMHLGGLTRAMYLARNKDTDELYSERVNYDEAFARRMLDRAKTIILSARPPHRIANDPNDFRCKFCSHHSACWGSASPGPAVSANVNCRTCCHSTPIVAEESNAALWRCDRHRRTLTNSDELRGCEDHLFIPDLITFAEVYDGGTDDDGVQFVVYRNNDATAATWTNSRRRGEYRSVELQQLPASLVGAGTIEDLKGRFGAVAVEGV